MATSPRLGDGAPVEPSNYAVVQLPDRKYPGVVFQGDSLNALVQQLRGALRAARGHNDDELNAELEGVELPFTPG